MTRQDLFPGSQVAQALHAFREFIRCYPETERNWFENSNHICILAVKDLWELEHLKVKASDAEILQATFREPDLDNELTAIAFAPGDKTKKILSGIPLALKQYPLLKREKVPRKEEVIEAMKNCYQFEDVNMLQHGEMVWDWYQYFAECLQKILDTQDGRKTYPLEDRSVKLPAWFYEYAEELMQDLYPHECVREYLIYHDCGKPYCKTVDDKGRQHFPNHAAVSAKIYFDAFDGERKKEIAILIARDMDIHKLKAKGVEEFSKRHYLGTSLLAGLAEIHANSSMFGGIESTSFKIKWKQLDRRGKSICKILRDKLDGF